MGTDPFLTDFSIKRCAIFHFEMIKTKGGFVVYNVLTFNVSELEEQRGQVVKLPGGMENSKTVSLSFVPGSLRSRSQETDTQFIGREYD